MFTVGLFNENAVILPQKFDNGSYKKPSTCHTFGYRKKRANTLWSKMQNWRNSDLQIACRTYRNQFIRGL